jgi:hypothetical protein
MLVAAGLPADLNKLKKEQLLDELDKRGLLSGGVLNAKSLKKDLVEGLRNGLLSQSLGATATQMNR